MKKFSSFILVLLLSLVIGSPVLSQDNSSIKEYNSYRPGPVNLQNPNLDGPTPPTTQVAVTVLPGNNSTSSNGRAPQGSRFFINSKYIIRGAEMTASGFGATTVQSVGWRWNAPFPPAAGPPGAQSVATTGNLKVFLKDTVAGATTLAGATSTFIDTSNTTGGYVKIIDGTISIPAGITQIDIDVPVGGPGTAPFTTTAGNGVLVIFVYQTTTTLATPLGAPTVFCTAEATGTPMALVYQNQITSGNSGTVSNFRPHTRFGNTSIPACDVGPTNNFAPRFLIPTCHVIAPKATVHNYGSASQTGIQVTYSITGPAAYSNTKTVDLTSQESKIVTFDSTFAPTLPGLYNVSIYTTLACDTSKSNDTVKSTFSAKASDFGGPLMSCPYFFANSTPCASGAPSQPVFGWLDTTGSTSLVLNGVQQQAASFNGGLDDGHWKLEIPGPDQFRFCGVVYDSFFVGTNGMVAFSRAFNTDGQFNTSTPLAIPSTTAPKPAIFPFWKDFNFSDVDVPINRLSYKTLTTPGEGLVLLITYDRAPNFGATLATDYVSFQVILQLAPGPTSDGRIIFQYDDSRTGAEFLNKYFNLTLTSHTVGIQDQTGTSAIQYRRITFTTFSTVVDPGVLFTSPVAVAFGPQNNPLPVELASFTSSVDRRDVNLNWTTANESNNAGFDIERKSTINGEWSMIGNVVGSGTSTTPHSYLFIDRGLNSGKYNYRLKQIDFNGNFTYFNLSNEVGIGIPTNYDLAQNYPNPFNPTTKIGYDIPFDAKVSIKLFDLSGRELATLVNTTQTAGYYTINFNASNLASGVYFYRLSANDFVSTKKMMIVK